MKSRMARILSSLRIDFYGNNFLLVWVAGVLLSSKGMINFKIPGIQEPKPFYQKIFLLSMYIHPP